MKPFLLEVAEALYAQHYQQPDKITVVFPNRRAALYFRKHFSGLLDKPVFSPHLITIEDFITRLSALKVPDKLELIHRLYAVYHHVVDRAAGAEPFDQFYFWGDMLLRDFDEVDKYIVDAQHLFKDLSQQKELDTSFDFLTDEQKQFLKSFWINFEENESANKKKFLYTWRKLGAVYQTFRDDLKKDGLAYEGMLHREVAEHVSSAPAEPAQQIVFVGFNALTKAEEKIISHFVQQGATMYWDVDAYYVNNNTQEAGKFFRDYQQHEVFGKTFPHDIPAHFLQSPKKVTMLGAAQPVGQTKILAQQVKQLVEQGGAPEDTLVVLPDEKLLVPVLHGIADSVDKLNVTMGFPLSNTPLFNLMELIAELQVTRKDDHFNHRYVLSLLGHPYVVAADAGVAYQKRKEIVNHNWIFIPQSFLATSLDLHRLIFRPVDLVYGIPSVIQYLRSIVNEIGRMDSLSAFDKEYAFHFLTLLNRMEEIFGKPGVSIPGIQPGDEGRKKDKELLRSFLRIFRQLIRAEKIPFAGEPLKGLQIMGVLETRALDYKNVFILSLNEGAFPSFNSKGSYIPFNLRKAYALPTVEHQDSMYAYLFYRVLQRAENIVLLYNTETDVLGQGEMSRYLQQLVYESGLPINRKVLHNAINPMAVQPVTVKKDERVYDGLAHFCRGVKLQKELSPTALNDYIECRLKFYFRHVARIREAREVEEELDARVLGNFLHRVMELFYHDLLQRKKTTQVEAADLEVYETQIDHIIDRVFRDTYRLDPDKEVLYEGQRLVVKEVVKRFADRIIEIDKAYAPFTLEAVERKGLTYSVALDTEGRPEVVLGGVVDRADRKANVLRIIDYKTGKDELSFEDVSSLFNREGKRNKAAFQTLLYALLYHRNSDSTGVRLVPGLMNRVNLFDESFVFGLKQGKSYLTDATPLFPQFESELKKLLEEMFDPSQPFDQTHDVEVCKLCSYHSVCYR